MESPVQRDRLFVFSGLAVATAISWAYMLHMAWEMSGTGMDMTKPCLMDWGPGDLAHMFIMWAIMMVAMMFPAATPMILMFATVNRQRSGARDPLIPTGLFVLGYLVVWTAYSALATVAQWGLHVVALLTHTLVITSPLLAGTLLLAAGVFQWTPYRDACMVKCRSPLGFLMAEWREGRRGALVMGLKHGLNCVGCCWLLMTLSFVLGVMNMMWMAVLTLFMVVEKVCPESQWVSRTAGLILVVWGLCVAAGVMR
jgi:predicted metal-binding membrane protein